MKLLAMLALTACLLSVACTDPSSAKAPSSAAAPGHACMANGLVLKMFTATSHSSPFVKLNILTSDLRPHTAVMLLDTGSISSIVDREFARRGQFSNPEACALSGRLQLGIHDGDRGYVDANFSINRGGAGCRGTNISYREFTNAEEPIKQDGTVGLDLLRSRAFKLDFEAETVTLWDRRVDFADCSEALRQYRVVPFIRIYSDPTRSTSEQNPQPACTFHDSKVAAACAVPLLPAVIKGGSADIDFPMVVDTGREAAWPELVSVNHALFDILLSHGLVQSSSCPDGKPTTLCDIGVYALTPGLIFEGGGIGTALAAVELRDASYGSPYNQPIPVALVGMKLFETRRAVIFDPFQRRLLLY